MKRLAALQREFQRHVYRDGGAMERAVVATPRADAARRLGVYAYAYRSRLVGALANDYPALQGLLGERGFERMLREFIDAHPSHFANLRWYGGELPRFLSLSPRWRRRPLLAELARFEWALGLAFDASDASPVTVDDVGRVPAANWPAMRIRLDPSAQQLSLRSNAPQVWRVVSEGGKPPRAVARARPLSWLVWRKFHAPFYRPLARDESWALGAAERGCGFSALCEGLRRFVGSARAAPRAAQLLKGWVHEGLVCAIY